MSDTYFDDIGDELCNNFLGDSCLQVEPCAKLFSHCCNTKERLLIPLEDYLLDMVLVQNSPRVQLHRTFYIQFEIALFHLFHQWDYVSQRMNSASTLTDLLNLALSLILQRDLIYLAELQLCIYLGCLDLAK